LREGWVAETKQPKIFDMPFILMRNFYLMGLLRYFFV
jgi:hypothetical protein